MNMYIVKYIYMGRKYSVRINAYSIAEIPKLIKGNIYEVRGCNV